MCLWSTIVVFAFLPLSQRLLFELRPGSNGEPEAQEAGAGQSLRRQGGLDGIFQLVFICPIFSCIPISQSAFVCISMPQLLLQFRFSFWIHQTFSKLIRYFDSVSFGFAPFVRFSVIVLALIHRTSRCLSRQTNVGDAMRGNTAVKRFVRYHNGCCVLSICDMLWLSHYPIFVLAHYLRRSTHRRPRATPIDPQATQRLLE